MIPEKPPRALTQDDIEAFHRDGVICIRGLYSPRWIETMTQALDRLYAAPLYRPLASAAPRLYTDSFAWQADDGIRDFVLHGPSAHIVQQVFGSSKVNFFYDQIFIKKEMTPDPTPWHHDFTFWPIEGTQIASLWASVDAVTSESSALEFIAGSHRWEKRWLPVGASGVIFSSEELEPLPDIESDRSAYPVLSWDLEPGDALLFHALTVHGAQGNRSPNTQRRAITTRWCGDDVTFRPRGGQMPIRWNHGLQSGDPLSGFVFPQVLPEIDLPSVEARLRGPIPADDDLVLAAQRQIASARRAPRST